LPGLVAFADDEFEAAAGKLVDRGVVLGDPDRVEYGQHADPGLDPDPAGRRRDGPEQHRHHRGEESSRVPLTESDRVVAELLGPAGRRQRLRKPLGRADQPAGDRVLEVRQDVEHLESHDAFPPD
jgi:hypothetical protein